MLNVSGGLNLSSPNRFNHRLNHLPVNTAVSFGQSVSASESYPVHIKIHPEQLALMNQNNAAMVQALRDTGKSIQGSIDAGFKGLIAALHASKQMTP